MITTETFCCKNTVENTKLRDVQTLFIRLEGPENMLHLHYYNIFKHTKIAQNDTIQTIEYKFKCRSRNMLVYGAQRLPRAKGGGGGQGNFIISHCRQPWLTELHRIFICVTNFILIEGAICRQLGVLIT